jgi:hypothetical protein
VWQVVKDFFAIPTVVATGQDLYAVAEQVFSDARRNAEAGSRVFAVGDDEVDVVVLDEIRKAVMHDAPAGRANDVTNEQNSHEVS